MSFNLLHNSSEPLTTQQHLGGMIHSFSWGRVSSLACRRHFPLQASSIPYITQPVAAFSTKHKQQYKGHTSRNVQPPHNKGKWHPYEDEMLREAVRAHRDEAGTIEWSAVKVRMEGTRSYQQSIDRWLKHLKLHEENDSYRKSDEPPVQNYWSESEDELLRQAISQHKYKTNKGKNKVNWNGVLAHFQGTRSYMQCYLRWNVVLKPRKLYKYGTWSTAEDDIILEAMAPGQPLAADPSPWMVGAVCISLSIYISSFSSCIYPLQCHGYTLWYPFFSLDVRCDSHSSLLLFPCLHCTILFCRSVMISPAPRDCIACLCSFLTISLNRKPGALPFAGRRPLAQAVQGEVGLSARQRKH